MCTGFKCPLENNSTLILFKVYNLFFFYLFELGASKLEGASKRLLTMLIDIFPSAKLTLGPERSDSSRDTTCCICVTFRENAFLLTFRRSSAVASALADESVEAVCDVWQIQSLVSCMHY